MVSKYQPKQPINTSSENKKLTTLKEIESYVKRVNPYKKGKTSVQGVVPEVVNYFMLVKSRKGEVTTGEIDQYFQTKIPFNYQKSGEYINEIVTQTQREQGLKETKVSDELLSYIRNELEYKRAMMEEFGRTEVQFTHFEALDRKGNIKKGLDARMKSNGAVVADVYTNPEKYGGYIRVLYEKGKKLTPKAQLTNENVKAIYEKMGLKSNDEDVKGVIEQIKRDMFLPKGETKQGDEKKYSHRQYTRGVIDLTSTIKQTIFARRAKLDEDIMQLIGKYKDMGDVIDDFDTFVDDFYAPKDVMTEGEIQQHDDMRYDFNNFTQEIHNGLIMHTTERMIPLIYHALKQGMKDMTVDGVNKVLIEIYENSLNPDDVYMYYEPNVLSEWCHKVLPKFNVPSGLVDSVASECFNETRAEVYEHIRKRGYGATERKTRKASKTASKVRNKRKK